MSKRKAESEPEGSSPSDPKRPRTEVEEVEILPEAVKNRLVFLGNGLKDTSGIYAQFVGPEYPQVARIMRSVIAKNQNISGFHGHTLCNLFRSLAIDDSELGNLKAIGKDEDYMTFNIITLHAFMTLRQLTRSHQWTFNKHLDVESLQGTDVAEIIGFKFKV